MPNIIINIPLYFTGITISLIYILNSRSSCIYIYPAPGQQTVFSFQSANNRKQFSKIEETLFGHGCPNQFGQLSHGVTADQTMDSVRPLDTAEHFSKFNQENGFYHRNITEELNALILQWNINCNQHIKRKTVDLSFNRTQENPRRFHKYDFMIHAHADDVKITPKTLARPALRLQLVFLLKPVSSPILSGA